jgi:1-acyl-sn-glycerol-3-phosphate acyltransferase
MKRSAIDLSIDVVVTLLCWLYFTLGFVLLFSPFYIGAAFFSRNPEQFFQRLNRTFYRGFFLLLVRLAPRQQWAIDERIADIRSSVVVCNHLSYLDPLLLIALLGRSKTIVKPVFFRIPIFGWVLRTAGYFPATASGPHGRLMLEQMEKMGDYLADGGNLFIFPEGTRNRSGEIGALNPGAGKIARNCRVPIQILCLRNTERLFTPGRFFFFTRRPNRISVRLADSINPTESLSLAEVEYRIRANLQECLGGDAGPTGEPVATNGEAGR